MRALIRKLALCGIASALVAPIPGNAAAPAVDRRVSTIDVGLRTPPGRPGFDTGLRLDTADFVRITASGVISLYRGPCGHGIEPRGCTAPVIDPAQPRPLVAGALSAQFYDTAGTPLGALQAVGEYGVLRVPANAKKLYLKIFAMPNPGYGSFHVIADALPNDPAKRGALERNVRSGGIRRMQASRRGGDPGASNSTDRGTSRSDIQHLVRRFGFSDTPENITAIQNNGGAAAWLATQLNPNAIDDTASIPYINRYPTVVNQNTSGLSSVPEKVFANRAIQLPINSKRQLLEKMVLYWTNHFAVNKLKVDVYDYQFHSMMEHYVSTLRTDGMGNFQSLLTDVALEPAMQIWLDEVGVIGNDPNVPPNENFAREIMQLYSIGPLKLNPDGTNVVDSTGTPVVAYTEADIKTMAIMLSGMDIEFDHDDGSFPTYSSSTKFYSTRHPAAKTYSLIGKTIVDAGGNQCIWSKFTHPSVSGTCVYKNIINVLAHDPTTWAFESKELLVRLVTQHPSPGYVSRITAVWGANVDSPTQIAQVLKAIAEDPEFYTAKYSMVKEPMEYTIDAIRALHGANTVKVSASVEYPQDDTRNTLRGMGQDPFYPPSVFGFYPIGNKEALVRSNPALINRWKWLQDLNGGVRFTTLCTTCVSSLDMRAYKNSTAAQLADYLLDALVDGGSPQLRASVKSYLERNPDNKPGAIWIILTSPEYQVN